MDTFFISDLQIRECSPRESDLQDKRHRLDVLKQTGTVEEFNHQFESIVGKLPAGFYSEETKVDIYVRKLQYHVRSEVQYRYPEDIEEAQNLALAFENKYYEPQDPTTNNTKKQLGNKSRNDGTGNSQKARHQNKVPRQTLNNKKTIKRCFYCGETDHLIARCHYK
ncbi:uncharacterized protein AC631_02329 [Debaryomyces fabryi]|uniref:Ty3 transposon capsid-like protein domain-containing protein n=1 Tax=Debaryomyces fabryi TaxID=58627 RepID=A0A0V1Q044_9ASCO|nr:uncharacterized protein AC631_02329 [Debaryomyces fabryi]KSA01873.1 hypothetical protein AC631_02329 [Debaryomyces fabryi]CUM53491.1 unnamed protein product [Debaryomyces fabryi]